MRNADDERTVKARWRLVHSVKRRRRQRDRQAVERREDVLGVRRRVVRGAARGNRDVLDARALDLRRDAFNIRRFRVEEPRERGRLFGDFAEEFGFVGSLIILLLYVFLLFRMINIAKKQREKPLLFLTMAFFCSLGFQTAVNIGMNIAVLPITGITLPLMSYGGSSLLATMISLGILENISQKAKKEDVIEIR